LVQSYLSSKYLKPIQQWIIENTFLMLIAYSKPNFDGAINMPSEWTKKLDRAKEHFTELQNEVNSFFALQPYRVATKRDPQTKRLIYYLSEVKDVPAKIAIISGDIIQNLRSSLDHLAYELFIKGTQGTQSGRHVNFPISKDFTTYQKNKNDNTRGISQADKTLIDGLRPYKGGNNILWEISFLNNIDKHRYPHAE
jgi:hypothetical protein